MRVWPWYRTGRDRNSGGMDKGSRFSLARILIPDVWYRNSAVLYIFGGKVGGGDVWAEQTQNINSTRLCERLPAIYNSVKNAIIYVNININTDKAY